MVNLRTLREDSRDEKLVYFPLVDRLHAAHARRSISSAEAPESTLVLFTNLPAPVPMRILKFRPPPQSPRRIARAEYETHRPSA